MLVTLLLAYIYAGYPLILLVLARCFPRRHHTDDRFEPTITLVISCRNEENVIKAKLENSLRLDYPPEKLTVMVVSDCSGDATDSIVLSFRNRGVILVRQEERKGKTSGLNLALARVTSDIVIFSDANAMYDRFAVRGLVRHFADDRVGYVVGDARYENSAETAAGNSEGTYWHLEEKIKQWESAFSSVVGGDGAIYAIRRNLYEPLLETDINDFVNPLQIVAKGYRGVFDRDAWCSEKPAGEFQKEFARKIRIANRSFNGLLRVPGACNPFKVGRFAWQLVSHKLLRWLSPLFVMIHFALAIAADQHHPLGSPALCFTWLYCVVALLALIGWWEDGKGKTAALFHIPYYLVLMNVASTIGILLKLKGEVITTWETVRGNYTFRNRVITLVPILLASIVVVCLYRIFQWFDVGLIFMHAAAMGLVSVLAYTYLGYPIVVAALARLSPVETEQDEGFLPDVTLLIVAYNEEQNIETKLVNSLELDYPHDRLHIVVASDGSTDRTNSIVQTYADRNIRLLPFHPNQGKTSALTKAMARISSEIVVFSDANVVYHPHAIRRLVRHFSDSRVGAVSGKVILLNSTISYGAAENQYYHIEHFVQEQEGKTGTVIGADGAMYAIRRALFLAPPPDTIIDDFAIAMNIARAGYLVLHDKEALGYEDNLAEIDFEFRRKVRIIAGGIQCLLTGNALPHPGQRMLWFKFLSHKVLRWFSGVQTLLLLFLLLEICRIGGNVLFSSMLCLLLAVVLVAVVGQVVPVTRKIVAVNLLHYMFMLKLAALVGCYVGFFGRQNVTWRAS